MFYTIEINLGARAVSKKKLLSGFEASFHKVKMLNLCAMRMKEKWRGIKKLGVGTNDSKAKVKKEVKNEVPVRDIHEEGHLGGKKWLFRWWVR